MSSCTEGNSEVNAQIIKGLFIFVIFNIGHLKC